MDPQSAMAAQLANMAKPHQKITQNITMNNANTLNSTFIKPVKQEVMSTSNSTTQNSARTPAMATNTNNESQVWQKMNFAIDALMRFYNVKSQRGNIGGNPEGPIVDLLPSGLTKRQVLAQIGLQLGIKAEDMPALTGSRGGEMSSGAWSNSSSSSPQRTGSPNRGDSEKSEKRKERESGDEEESTLPSKKRKFDENVTIRGIVDDSLASEKIEAKVRSDEPINELQIDDAEMTELPDAEIDVENK